ncbi:MAG: hypothetical protein V1824_02405 [archaeon]
MVVTNNLRKRKIFKKSPKLGKYELYIAGCNKLIEKLISEKLEHENNLKQFRIRINELTKSKNLESLEKIYNTLNKYYKDKIKFRQDTFILKQKIEELKAK